MDRKNIVFVVGCYRPYPSAVGVCAEKIINIFKIYNDVTVVSIKDRCDLPDDEIYNGYNLVRVTTAYNRKRFKISAQQFSLSLIIRFKLIFMKFMRFFAILCSNVTIDKDLVNSYYFELKKIADKKKIDVIIPLCFPFESIVAASKFSDHIDQTVQVIPYLFDNFAHSASLHRFNWNRKLKLDANKSLELKMLQFSNAVFAMHPLKDYFQCNFPTELLKKISYIEHPLLECPDFQDKSIKVNNKINLIYAGGLFKNVREPTYMLRLLERVNENVPIKIDIYSFGNASEEANKYSAKHKYSFFHGQVKRDEIICSYSYCDVLVNLGEIEGKQISSKIFEYMSLGKPLIHIAFTKNCVVSNLLKKYPLAMVICIEDDFESNSILVTNFLIKYSKERLVFDFVQNLFFDATPQYTVDKMMDIIYGERLR